jgi:hypothetical protein
LLLGQKLPLRRVRHVLGWVLGLGHELGSRQDYALLQKGLVLGRLEQDLGLGLEQEQDTGLGLVQELGS